MRLSQLLSIGLLTTFGLTAIAQVASAGINVGADASNSNATNKTLIVTGLTPYTKYKIVYGSSMKTVTKKANECGFFKLAATSTSFPVGSGDSLFFEWLTPQTKTVASLPVQAAPKCTNGALSGTNLTPSVILKTAEGDVYVTGLGDFESKPVGNAAIPNTTNVKSNGCGVVKMANLLVGVETVLKTEAGSTVLTVANPGTTPAFPIAPTCKENTLLLPAGFPNL